VKTWFKRAVEKLDQLNYRAESWISTTLEKISHLVALKRGTSA
jgi:hypothetical protein